MSRFQGSGRHRSGRIPVALAAFVLAVAAPVQSQTPEEATAKSTSPAAAEAAPAGPQPIAASDIAPQAEQVTTRLREITKLAEPADAPAQITNQLPATEQEVQRLDAKLAYSQPISLRRIKAQRQHWTTLNNLLDKWQDVLQKRSSKLQTARDELNATRAVWQVTQGTDLPDSVQQQVASTLASFDEPDTVVSQRIDELLTLQGQVSKQRQVTSKALETLEDLEGANRAKLFVRDHDPLWRDMTSDDLDLATELSQSRTALVASVSEFTGRYRTHVAVHALIYVVLIVLILVARRAVPPDLMSDTEIKRISIVMNRPFSTAFLLSLVVLLALYPINSAEVRQVARLVFLLPMLRLLPAMVPRLRGLIVILSFVYVAEIVSQLAMDGSVLQRLLLLVSTALAFALFAWGLVTSQRQPAESRTSSGGAVRVLLWLGVLALVTSLVANVVGDMSLAMLLGTATFNAIWAAVMIGVAFRLVAGLLNLVLRSTIARRLRSVRDRSKDIFLRVMGVVHIAGVVLWIVMVLSWLQLRQPLFEWTSAALSRQWTTGTLTISISRIAAFFIAIAIAIIVSKLVRFFVEQELLSRLQLSRGACNTISTLVNYAIVGAGVVIAFAASGIELSSLGFIVGALSVGIGFGLRDIVHNFVSGLIIIIERPVKVGDLVEVSDTLGNVTRIGARSTTVRTFSGAEIVVPNGILISSNLTNWTLSDEKRRAEIVIPVALGTDPNHVMKILEDTAREQSNVLDDPEPFAEFDSFTEFGMAFVLRFWPDVAASRILVTNQLVAAALDAMHQAGITVPRPQRDVHLKREDHDAGDPAKSE